MILLARPAPHLPPTLAALQAEGVPLSKILAFSLAEPVVQPFQLPAGTTALLLTSRFGVPQNAPFRHLPTFCVGGCTAKAAKEAGFNVVYTGVNNGHSMAHDILAQMRPPQTFAHLHGDKAGMEWHSLLSQAGHTVTPILTYHTNPIPTLPEAAAESLRHTPPELTLLFSAESTRHLAKLLKQANIPVAGTALCLSPAVADAARTSWCHVQTAAQPSLEGLLTLLAQVQHERTTP